ncbi:hypothetical protein M7I_0512 [Glarea lozoyensis 74030]|uniref:Uncharacterized protein n=1 Tax=Glarea lozoyensis (strain ATCC 74030 / MF5533) TaxID=1104152 RepID=H0EDQ7_GLAL7|nr:hypothetical protein M7I_0512 [Glarea lozoyensis 74030]
MKVSSSQLLLGSLFLLQVAGLVIQSEQEHAGVAVRSEQLIARVESAADRAARKAAQKQAKEEKNNKKKEDKQKKKDDKEKKKQDKGKGKATVDDESAGAGSSANPDFAGKYKETAESGGEPKPPSKTAADFLEETLGDDIRQQLFTTFIVESVTKSKAKPGTAEFKQSLLKVRYSEQGMIVDSMYKAKDGNPKKAQIPITKLMSIGAKQLKSTPQWIFCGKIANEATRKIIIDGLAAKYGSETGAATDKIWKITKGGEDNDVFTKLMVCLDP